jgi:putative transcription antitermination factor YqgF
MRFLGVDPGGSKMGLAVGDDQTGVVSPLETVKSSGLADAARIIADTVVRIGAGKVVLGVPALADGSLGPAARRSKLLAEAVRKLGVEVDLQSEYLSTDEARRRARDIGRPRNRPVDDLAAQIILEDYLAGPTRSGASED